MKDNIISSGKWKFDSSVTDSFDDMLSRSIPLYGVMRSLCNDIACKYITPGSTILDIGCSRGEAIDELVKKYGAQNKFIGLEVSYPMINAAREKFKGYIDCGVVSVLEFDLRESRIPASNVSVVLSVLTLQFIPIEYRKKILADLYSCMNKGSCLILVEKVLGSSQEIDHAMTTSYYKMKSENGYTEEQIKSKKRSLEGVLVPLPAKWNEELLLSAGFDKVDCFWRWMNFCGLIALKS